jgi:Flp pilus assembly protein TadB
MTSRAIEEYRALRDTIRERGTARPWVALAALALWAALAVVTFALAPFPAASVLPLVVLAAGFEIVFTLHTGVERIGRFLQVFHEDATGWEHIAMAYGQRYGGSAGDPLFANFFRTAAVLNAIPAAYARPLPVEWVVVGVIHALFIVRVEVARRQAARQRATDLERFRQLKREVESS